MCKNVKIVHNPPAKGDFAICSGVFVHNSGQLVPTALLWPYFSFARRRFNWGIEPFVDTTEAKNR